MKDFINVVPNLLNGIAVWIIEHKLFGWAVAILCAFAVCLSSGSAYAMYQHEGVYKERKAEWDKKYDGVQLSIDSLKQEILLNRTIMNTKFDLIEKLITREH